MEIHHVPDSVGRNTHAWPCHCFCGQPAVGDSSANESHHRHATIEARLDQLEKASMESARLLQEIAQQVQALTIAQEQTARRAAIAMALGAAAAVVGIGAGVLAAIRRHPPCVRSRSCIQFAFASL